MLSYRLTNCVDCATIPVMLTDIDCKLTKMAKDHYNTIVFGLNRPLDQILMFDLLHYKRILQCKKCNSEWASCYSEEEIAGKVKLLIFK